MFNETLEKKTVQELIWKLLYAVRKFELLFQECKKVSSIKKKKK